MLARLLYTLAWLFILPFALLRLMWKGRKQPAYLKHVRERLGRYRRRIPGRVIWVHAVSLGETRAAEPLVWAMRERWPDHTVLLTHMTPTGRAAAKSMFGGDTHVRRVYLPYDLPWFVSRFLNRFNPEFGVIMETELWPNLLAACNRRRIPVLLANARLSERSASRYRLLPGLSRATFSRLSAIGAQSDEDACRLASLGAVSPQVTGSVKFDITPPPRLLELGTAFRQRAGNRRIVLAASTREGEEALMLDAFTRMTGPDAHDVLLVIVPRHPERFDDVAGLIAERALIFQRRSADEPIAATCRVWLGDSMGELFAYYAMADIALIGGCWLPFGGQNPIEASAVGTPAVLGPFTFHFERIAAQAVQAGAAVRTESAEAGMQTALKLLEDAQACAAMSSAGKRFVEAHRGATQKTMALIESMQGGCPPVG